jgi:polyisoprenoid-binding protein YceI
MKTMNYLLALALLLFGNMLFAQKVEVNTKTSSVEWHGKKIGSQHNGNIQLKSGYFELQDGSMVAGNFVVDMTSITNTDQENENYNQKLVGHLKSDDFFGIEKYPTAKFELTQSSKFSNGKATISGDITIKDKTENISFEVIQDGQEYTASIALDRSKFDVRYGSNSFFDNLGDKAINDIFTLDIRLIII